jgi:hypothetical protein
MMKTKIFLSLCASASLLVLLFTTATLALAASPYQSGFKHGVSDGKIANQGSSDWYILQPGKSFAFHTQEFNNGYIAGFCSVVPPGTGSDADQADFECPR